jgi:alkaline phosphatase D
VRPGSRSVGGNANTATFHATYDPIMAGSRHWKYIDNRRGYVVCDVTEEALHARLRIVDTVLAPEAQVSTAARVEVVAGVPGVHVLSEDTPA